MNVSTATPAEIDTRLAVLYAEAANLDAAYDRAVATVERIDALDADSYERKFAWNSPKAKAEAEAILTNAATRQREIATEAKPMEDRYAAERWTRFYLVTNAGGHVHSSTACDTCFITTRYAWLTEQSGMTHEALVEMAGEQACTVCFPDAPVDVLSRKSKIEAPEKKARREERERKAAEKAAAQIAVEGYVEYSRRGPETKVFKTARAVTNALASNLGDLCWYGESHPEGSAWLSNVKALREALDAKGAEYDYDKSLANARKKVTREGGAPKF